jgi:predicted cupin superfamily sugar epimerase
LDPPKSRIESFTVGPNVSAGEKLQWIVEGDVYKASFLLSDEEEGKGSGKGLLISETVVPGFEYYDHDFLNQEGLKELVGAEEAGKLEWLISPLAAGKWDGSVLLSFVNEVEVKTIIRKSWSGG